MDKFIGTILDNRYELLEVIGVGGTAVVYKAKCHRLNRYVAVKILKEEYAQSMLANSITLTPGTIPMATAEEDGQLNYYIHWIDVATQDNQEAGDAIKGTLEKWVRRIWE